MEVTDRQIEDQITAASQSEFGSLYPGLTYEQGVRAALEWVLFGEEPPMEDADV